MTTTQQQSSQLQRAATAYRLALDVRADATRIAAEYPKVAAKLEEAARLLIAEGKAAEARTDR